MQRSQKSPQDNLRQTFQQLSQVNIRQKLKQSTNTRQTQQKLKCSIQLKIYQSFSVAILNADPYQQIFKFYNHKQQQQGKEIGVQIFQKLIKIIGKKQQIRQEKLISVWHKNGTEQNFVKKINSSSDIQQYLKIKSGSPEISLFILLIMNSISKYYQNKNPQNQQDQKNFRAYSKKYYTLQKQYLNPAYRILFPKYQQGQIPQYYLDIQNSLKLKILILQMNEKLNKILKNQKNDTDFIIKIILITKGTSEFKINKKDIQYKILLNQQLSIENIKYDFIKFIKCAEMQASLNIISDLRNKQIKPQMIQNKLMILKRVNRNNKLLKQFLNNNNIINRNQSNFNQNIQKIDIFFQSNEETNIWELMLRLCNYQFLQKPQKIQYTYNQIVLQLTKEDYQKKLQQLGNQLKKCNQELFIKNIQKLWKILYNIKLNKFKLYNKYIKVRIPVAYNNIFKIIECEYKCKIIDCEQIQISIIGVSNINDDNKQQKNKLLLLKFKNNKELNKQIQINKLNMKSNIINLLVYICEKESDQLSDLEIQSQVLEKQQTINKKTKKIQLWNLIESLIQISEFSQSDKKLLKKQIWLKPHQDLNYLNNFEQNLRNFKKYNEILSKYQQLKQILQQQTKQFSQIKLKCMRRIKKIHKIFEGEKDKICKLLKQSISEKDICFQLEIQTCSQIRLKVEKYKIKQPLLYLVFELITQKKQLIIYSVWNFNQQQEGQTITVHIQNQDINKKILGIIKDTYSKYITNHDFINKFQNYLLEKECLIKFNGGYYGDILTQSQQNQQQTISQANTRLLQALKNKLRIYSYDDRLSSLLKRIEKYGMLDFDYNNPLLILEFDGQINLLKLLDYRQQVIKTQYCPNFNFRKIKQKILKMILIEYQKIQKNLSQQSQIIKYNQKRLQIDRIKVKIPQDKISSQLYNKKIQKQKQLQLIIKQQQQQQKYRQQQKQMRNRINQFLNIFYQLKISVSDNSVKQYLQRLAADFVCQFKYNEQSILNIKSQNNKYMIYSKNIPLAIELTNFKVLVQKYFQSVFRSLCKRLLNSALNIKIKPSQNLSKLVQNINKWGIKLSTNINKVLLIIQCQNDVLIISKQNGIQLRKINMNQHKMILIYYILKHYNDEEILYEDQKRIRKKIEQQKEIKKRQQNNRRLQLIKLQNEEINKIKQSSKNILKIQVKKEDDWKLLQQNLKQIRAIFNFQLKQTDPLIILHYKSTQLTIECNFAEKKIQNITITSQKDQKFIWMILEQYYIFLKMYQEHKKQVKNQIVNKELRINITVIKYYEQKIQTILQDLANEYQLKLSISSDNYQMKIEFVQTQKRIYFKTKNDRKYHFCSFDKSEALLLIKNNIIPNYIPICKYNKNNQQQITYAQNQKKRKAQQIKLRKQVEQKLYAENKEKQQIQKKKKINRQNQLKLLQENSKREQALLQKLKADKQKKQKQQRQKMQEIKKRQQKYEKELQQRRKLELTKKIESRQKLVTQLKSISKQPNKFGFRSDFFPQPCKESQLILQQIARLGFRFNKLNPKNTLNLIVLKNMHDRGGLDLLDSQLNYQFQQLKNILNTQYCLFINLSPKCHLKSSTFKQLFLKRMKLLGYELEESVNKSNVDFIHFQFDMLNKKLIYPGNSSSEQLKEILNRLQRASQMQT